MTISPKNTGELHAPAVAQGRGWLLAKRGAGLGIAFASLLGCSGLGAQADEGSASGGGGRLGGGTGGTAGTGFGTGGTGGGAEPPPPEREVESSFRTPIATSRFVWTANPQSGRVALVDAFSLGVRVEEAGFGPTEIAAVPDPDDPSSDVAIVLNVLSRDATLFRVRGTDAPKKTTLKTHAGANAWVVSPNGRWAVAWTDAARVPNPDPTDGFQEITVISLAEGSERSTRLTVGYRPVELVFNAAETRLFAVTEPGISVVVLDLPPDPVVDRLIEVTEDPLDNPASRDVLVTPDGSLALVRREGKADVGVVRLDTGALSSIPLSGGLTDLDLSPDGKLAVAVIRETSEVALLPVPAVVGDPSVVERTAVPGEFFGSVALSPDASVALLYTNATPSDRLTILNLAAGPEHLATRTVALKAPVTAVFPAADARHAVVLLDPGPGSTKPGAFSIVPIAAAIAPKIVGTDAPATTVAIRPPPDSDRALVTIRDDATRKFGVYVVRLPNLQVDLIELASPPIATGILPAAARGYVAQQHPEGRISFVDLVMGKARTLTGFELGADVVDE